MAQLSSAASEAESAAARRLEIISQTSERFRQLGELGKGTSGRTRELEQVLSEIVGANAQIGRFARPVNVLAINASSEIARAGAAGLGFAIVAEAINELSRKTAQAAAGVEVSIGSFDD